MAGEKTERATPKRKKDERDKGNIFMSREVITVASLLTIFVVLRLLLPSSVLNMQAHIEEYIRLGSEFKSIETANLQGFFMDGLWLYATSALPILLAAMLIGMIATMAQTKMMFSTKAIAFKGERISPLKGFKRMFSIRSIVELVKAMLKISLLIFIIYSILSAEIFSLPALMQMHPIQAMALAGDLIFNIAISSGVIFLFLAAMDYFYQWWQYEKNLRMSKQEVKDEYKQIEGDPQVKAQIRSLQQQMARQRMMQRVPEADVVIRNPTHYAVAIKYDSKKNRAPIVVAKGMDSLALRIIKVAEENFVYVTENRPLARALYENVDLEMEIPSEHYQAIAEILAFIYKLNKNKKDLKQ